MYLKISSYITLELTTIPREASPDRRIRETPLGVLMVTRTLNANNFA